VPERTTFSWDRLTVTCVLSFCILVCGLSVGLVLGELRDQFAISGVLAAMHGAAFGVGLLVMSMAGLPLVAALGRPRGFWVASGSIVVGVAVLCAGQSWPVTLLGSTIAGLACAFLVMLMPGIMADHHGDAMTGAFAAVNGVPGVAGIAFSLVVGAVITAGGSWRWPYLVLTLLIGAATVLVGRRVRIPNALPTARSALPLLRQPDVRRSFIKMVHAVLAEFPIGVWAVTFLKEVGGASAGTAATLGAVWGTCIMVSRLLVPRTVALLGRATVVVGYAMVVLGSLLLWTGPGLGVRVLGVVIAGLGCAPLYPLAVEHLYDNTDADSVTLGALTALASGVAVTAGPLVVGVIADSAGLRNAMLFVTGLAALGVVTNIPRRQPSPALSR